MAFSFLDMVVEDPVFRYTTKPFRLEDCVPEASMSTTIKLIDDLANEKILERQQLYPDSESEVYVTDEEIVSSRIVTDGELQSVKNWIKRTHPLTKESFRKAREEEANLWETRSQGSRVKKNSLFDQVASSQPSWSEIHRTAELTQSLIVAVNMPAARVEEADEPPKQKASSTKRKKAAPINLSEFLGSGGDSTIPSQWQSQPEQVGPISLHPTLGSVEINDESQSLVVSEVALPYHATTPTRGQLLSRDYTKGDLPFDLLHEKCSQELFGHTQSIGIPRVESNPGIAKKKRSTPSATATRMHLGGSYTERHFRKFNIIVSKVLSPVDELLIIGEYSYAERELYGLGYKAYPEGDSLDQSLANIFSAAVRERDKTEGAQRALPFSLSGDAPFSKPEDSLWPLIPASRPEGESNLLTSLWGVSTLSGLVFKPGNTTSDLRSPARPPPDDSGGEMNLVEL